MSFITQRKVGRSGKQFCSQKIGLPHSDPREHTDSFSRIYDYANVFPLCKILLLDTRGFLHHCEVHLSVGGFVFAFSLCVCRTSG